MMQKVSINIGKKNAISYKMSLIPIMHMSRKKVRV